MLNRVRAGLAYLVTTTILLLIFVTKTVAQTITSSPTSTTTLLYASASLRSGEYTTANLTHIGPLPTSFSPPPDCFTAKRFDSDDDAETSSITTAGGGLAFVNITQTYSFGCWLGVRITCCAPDQGAVGRGGYYAPGFVPSGYEIDTAAAGAVVTISGGAEGRVACPVIQSASQFANYSVRLTTVDFPGFTSPASLSLECQYTSVRTGRISVPSEDGAVVVYTTYTASHPAIVYFDEAVSSSGTIGIPAPPTQTTQTGDDDGASNRGGLGPGAIAGIAVGVGIPVILLAMYLGYRVAKRRSVKSNTSRMPGIAVEDAGYGGIQGR